MPSFHPSRPAAAVLCLLAISSSAARGQEIDAPAYAETKNDTVVLDPVEVTGSRVVETPAVTSTRLALTTRETPQSVSVISAERIEIEDFLNIDDVLRNVTGVHASFYDTERPLYFARGFQITDFQVDGIPTYSGSTNQEYDIALYDSVNVVRGANGLTSGAGIPSAVIDLRRKRPGKEFAASVSGTVGSWDLFAPWSM